MTLNNIRPFLFVLILLLLSGCITKFVPEITENPESLVIEGLISDRAGPNTIKISKTLPLQTKKIFKPLSGCLLTITDDLGNSNYLTEVSEGTYQTNPDNFCGTVGRIYTLHIKTGPANGNLNYESAPVEMKSVPPIDSIYYEKLVLWKMVDGSPRAEGCRIYLNTHDPENKCNYYRWDFVETWDFRIPYIVPNDHCWISDPSDKIYIKSTASLAENRIERNPVTFISYETDRLKEKYSILVNQYSMNEDEFKYWESLKIHSENTGSLYDVIPASLPGNVLCIEKPEEKVLGYFCVSAVKSKRLFIHEFFRGIVNLYTECENAEYWNDAYIPNLGVSAWVIINQDWLPHRKVVTYIRGCADCTVRGTKQEPSFWNDDKK